MKYIKWTVVIVLSVIVSVAFAESVSNVLGVSTEISMLIICFVVFPLIDFVLSVFAWQKTRKHNRVFD